MVVGPEPLAPGVGGSAEPPFASVVLDEQPTAAMARLALRTLRSLIVAM
jgi:hypothetical protein